MKTRFFTFGYDHVHAVDGFTYDKDIVVRITAEDPRAVMLGTFGREWSSEYAEDQIDVSRYPRGVVDLGVPRVEVVSDADRLRGVVEDAASILQAFVGGSPFNVGASGLVNEFDASKRAHVLVDRTQVPEALWRSAIIALDMLVLGLALTDPLAPASTESVEVQAAALMRTRGTL